MHIGDVAPSAPCIVFNMRNRVHKPSGIGMHVCTGCRVSGVRMGEEKLRWAGERKPERKGNHGSGMPHSDAECCLHAA